MNDLFENDLFDTTRADVSLGPGAVVLAGFVRAEAEALLTAVAAIAQAAPFRHLITPGGWKMSVAMTNCGQLGWVSDRRGYRYDPLDPESGRPWRVMPPLFLDLARRAAAQVGFADFAPEACLINRYVPGARLTLHQDRNERDLDEPIVSVSLGLPATFLWGGLSRADKTRRLRLVHGDVVVWGGPARMTFHGVDTLRDGDHPMTGAVRYNLTFRRAG
ncbi:MULTISPECIES: DNA oxidative demethylase AlkB [unclassified Beijerinckia]|uniref:DNA oxidative demethylase AlkB n=1 Tax=unclassified Beijerinckia TaxID=2638183 RepID=UPI00089D0B3B|nr:MULTISPECIES: DNA oxidative demethylase AlkB [unclassified Beijerinckia]MDH7794641.1 alkylated DNA repair protein (DNA oxidative demethylase) [Beijerinckia sp. GAS462]SEB69568.1 DNA-N1-methyladenine dioxygenase [Beijerinckia sp. 28-YEA-48]